MGQKKQKFILQQQQHAIVIENFSRSLQDYLINYILVFFIEKGLTICWPTYYFLLKNSMWNYAIQLEADVNFGKQKPSCSISFYFFLSLHKVLRE